MKAAVLVLGATGVIGRGVVAGGARGRPAGDRGRLATRHELRALQAPPPRCRPHRARQARSPATTTARSSAADAARRSTGRSPAWSSPCPASADAAALLDQPVERCAANSTPTCCRTWPPRATCCRCWPRPPRRQLRADRRPRQRTALGRLRPSLGRRRGAAHARARAARRSARARRARAVAVRRQAGAAPKHDARTLCPQWPTAIDDRPARARADRRRRATSRPCGRALRAGTPIEPAMSIPRADSTLVVRTDRTDSGSTISARRCPRKNRIASRTLLAARCLQDARALLESIASPNPNHPNQEASPMNARKALRPIGHARSATPIRSLALALSVLIALAIAACSSQAAPGEAMPPAAGSQRRHRAVASRCASGTSSPAASPRWRPSTCARASAATSSASPTRKARKSARATCCS